MSILDDQALENSYDASLKSINIGHKKAGHRRRRAVEVEQRRLRRMRKSPFWCRSGVLEIKNDEGDIIYLKRYCQAAHRNSRYAIARKQANRKVRHFKGDISNGGNYRRVSDYWWVVD